METAGKGLCVSLSTLRSLRLKNDLMANEVADQDADLLLGETPLRRRPMRMKQIPKLTKCHFGD